MTSALNRRWFAFSLRTMFAMLTVLCAWLAHELNWIRERHAFIQSELAIRKLNVPVEDQSRITVATTVATTTGALGPFAPSTLWAFGEGGLEAVFVLAEANDVQQLTEVDLLRVRRARRLFPEATVRTVHLRQQFSPFEAESAVPPD